MSLAEGHTQLERVYRRLSQLQERAAQLPFHEREVVSEALDELSTSLEELQVAEEELREQNDQLQIAHQLLELEQRRYQDLFDFAPDGYIVTDQHGIIREANQAAAVLLGVPADALPGKPLDLYVDDPGNRWLLAHLSQLDDKKHTQQWPIRVRPRGGKAFDAEATIVPIRDQAGAVTSIRWALRDISQRKAVEDRIRSNERQLADAQQIAHIGSWHWHIATDEFTWSIELYRICGLRQQQETTTVEHFMACFHPEDRERLRAAITRALDQHLPFALNHRIVRPDGTVRVLHALGHIVEDDTGQVIAINGSEQDITESHAAEERIRKLNEELEQRVRERTAALQSALERTRELYEISRLIGLEPGPNDVLGALTMSHYLQDIDRADVLLFDSPWLQTPPERGQVFASWHRESASTDNGVQEIDLERYGYARLFARDHPVYVGDVQTDPRLNNEARQRYLSIGTRALLLFPLIAAGKWFGMLSMESPSSPSVSDEALRHLQWLVDQAAVSIYNIRLLESEAEARRVAEKANDLKLKFLAMISHELRTPLTSIKGFATTLLADDVIWDRESEHDFISIIDVEADKLTDIIAQLLDLSRLEAGVLRIEPELHAVSDVIAKATAQLQSITIHHHLTVDVPTTLPRVKVDPLRLAQVLTNLVDNSVKYSPPDSDIVVSAHALATHIQVDVCDHGTGITAEERAYIFEPFRRGERDNTRRTKGAGLGLAICKGLIEAQGGSIWVQDKEGPGTTVSFTLPIAAEPEQNKLAQDGLGI